MKNSAMKEIPITEIEGFHIGNAEYAQAGTGCTVILADPAACTGLNVSGGAPASRESALLNPLAANDAVNAVLLCGGSAFGLAAADGVMQYLEERKIGFPTDFGVVPIVCASSIFDLPVGDASVRPDRELGYQACMNAGNFAMGNHGAGTGASCGKIHGFERAMKSGLGAYAVQIGALKIGAIVAANPLGNINDPDTGEVLAGIRGDNDEIVDSIEAFAAIAEKTNYNTFRSNTTIGAILTNASFSKTQLCKIAGMAQDGLARAINPVHTMSDGDSVYAMSSARVEADINIVGAIAAHVMARAIAQAARSAVSAYGLPACTG